MGTAVWRSGRLIAIEGQEDILDEPLDLDSVGPGQYQGLITFDRWTGIYPSTEISTDITKPHEFGLPTHYTVNTIGADTFQVHASRILRFIGPDVPQPEYQAQMYWGISVLEPVFEEVRKRDNMSWTILMRSLRASLIAQKNPELANALSGLGMSQAALQAFQARMEAQNELLSNQNMLILGKDGGLEMHSDSLSGSAEVYQQYQMDISGAAEYPMTRLFGRTMTGIGQSNDADEVIYEERIAKDQHETLEPQYDKLFPVVFMSEFGDVPKDLDYEFPSIRVLSEGDKIGLAERGTATIVAGFNAGEVSPQLYLRELQQLGKLTNVWSNITDEMMEAASPESVPPLEVQQAEARSGNLLEEQPNAENPPTKKQGAEDAAEFKESEHPRVKSGEGGGQFTSGSGGSGAGPSRSASSLVAAPDHNAWPEHIKKLKLPPAWKDVKISHDPNADLLAVGKDAKGRPQYVYSQNFQSRPGGSQVSTD